MTSLLLNANTEHTQTRKGSCLILNMFSIYLKESSVVTYFTVQQTQLLISPEAFIILLFPYLGDMDI